MVKYNLCHDLAGKENLEKGVYFCGRLVTESYLNMDKAMQSALELTRVFKKRYGHE
jgi:UDP-galactopyranose mutase